ncbi:hypothetical protein [Rubritalea tangerina]|uniref:hypothetical protein n=1 Tax=Rubritalea tangerina TaxID=430798 RepID=UPI00360C0C16
MIKLSCLEKIAVWAAQNTDLPCLVKQFLLKSWEFFQSPLAFKLKHALALPVPAFPDSAYAELPPLQIA